MNISLTAPLKAFVDSRVSSGDYTSASEFVRELIRAAQKRHTRQQRLDELLLQGLSSGETVDVDDGYFERKKQKLRDDVDERG